MAANQTKPKKKINWFLGCFGFSRERKKAKTAGGDAGRKKYFRLTWPKFRIMKKSAKNAAGLQKSSSHEGKAQRCIKCEELPAKPKQTLSVAVVARAVQLQSKEAISIDHKSQADAADQSQDAKCSGKELVIRNRKKREEPAGSVESNDKPAAAVGLVKKSRAKVKKRSVDGRDPMIGLSIVVVTLIVMLIWGRLCAILWTSAWFYCMPRLIRKAARQSNNEDANGKIKSSEFESELYNKKVVLKGFLQRDHKIPIVIGS